MCCEIVVNLRLYFNQSNKKGLTILLHSLKRPPYKWSYLLSFSCGLLCVDVDYNLKLGRNPNSISKVCKKMFYFQEACIEKIVRFISGDDRTDRWVASIGGSQYSYNRQNTYQRTISQDSNANSTRSESDTFINCQKDTQWLVGPTAQLTAAQSAPPPAPPPPPPPPEGSSPTGRRTTRTPANSPRPGTAWGPSAPPGPSAPSPPAWAGERGGERRGEVLINNLSLPADLR